MGDEAPKQQKPPDDLDIQIGVLAGFGYNFSEIARFAGVSEATVCRRRKERPEFIGKIQNFAEIGCRTKLAEKLKEIETKADAKARIQAAAYERLEQLLERGEADPKELDFLLLASVKEGLDRTEGKALDRKAILMKQQQDVTVHVVLDETVERIMSYASRFGQAQAALPPVEDDDYLPDQMEATHAEHESAPV